jgi:hypothetical protein
MSNMRKAISVLAASALVAALSAAPAGATPTPDPSCHGQQVSGFAHDFGGAAHAAEFFGLTVKEGQASVRAFCSEGSQG